MSELQSNLRYAIYARKSSEDNKRKQLQSIPDQIKTLNDFALKNGLNISESISESKSAKKPGREKFGLLVQMVYDKKIDAILCWNLDRLARNMVDGGVVQNLLEEGFIKEIRTPYERFNSESNSLYLAAKFGMSTQYSRDLKINVIRGQKSLLEKGLLPSNPPIGYKSAGKSIHLPGKNFKYVQDAFKMYDSGNYSLFRIAKILRNSGMTNKSGGQITKRTIEIILKNPFYKGEIHWGFKSGNGKIYQGQHKKAVEPELWQRVNDRLQEKAVVKSDQKLYLFQKKVFCECGRVMSNYQQKGINYLECKNPVCKKKFQIFNKNRKTIPETYLIQVMKGIAERMKLNSETYSKIKDKYIQRWKDESQITKKSISEHKRQIGIIDAGLNSLNEKYVAGDFSQEEYLAMKNDKTLNRQALINEIERLQKNESQQIIETFDDYLNIGNIFSAKFNKIPKESLKYIFELLVSRFEIRTGKLFLVLSKVGNCFICPEMKDVELSDFELLFSPLQRAHSHLAIQKRIGGDPYVTPDELFMTLSLHINKIKILIELIENRTLYFE